MDILWCDSDLVESRAQVHFREESGVLHFVDGVVDSRSRVDILDRDGVQPTVVHANALGLVVFSTNITPAPNGD